MAKYFATNAHKDKAELNLTINFTRKVEAFKRDGYKFLIEGRESSSTQTKANSGFHHTLNFLSAISDKFIKQSLERAKVPHNHLVDSFYRLIREEFVVIFFQLLHEANPKRKLKPIRYKFDQVVNTNFICTRSFIKAPDTAVLKDKGCAVCLDDFCEGDEVVFLKCNHPFHNGCIGEWSSNRAKGDTCPICRAQVDLLNTFNLNVVVDNPAMPVTSTLPTIKLIAAGEGGRREYQSREDDRRVIKRKPEVSRSMDWAKKVILRHERHLPVLIQPQDIAKLLGLDR